MRGIKAVTNQVFTVLENGDLRISLELELAQADSETRAYWRQLAESYKEGELLESAICNSEYDFVSPEELGALTDAPIIGAISRDDTGDITSGHIWYYDRYAIENPWTLLIDNGYVIFQNGGELETDASSDSSEKEGDNVLAQLYTVVVNVPGYLSESDPTPDLTLEEAYAQAATEALFQLDGSDYSDESGISVDGLDDSDLDLPQAELEKKLIELARQNGAIHLSDSSKMYDLGLVIDIIPQD
jgi:hypothetical protein